MSLSSRMRDPGAAWSGCGLGGCVPWGPGLVGALVADECPQDVDAAAGEGQDGLGVDHPGFG
jgi:hypothetical protein